MLATNGVPCTLADLDAEGDVNVGRMLQGVLSGLQVGEEGSSLIVAA